MTFGLYIHIPFCLARCSYCDFFSTVLSGKTSDMLPSFVEALLEELKGTAPLFSGRELRSIFFGGGTPSLLRAGDLERILDGVMEHFSIAEKPEITLESNPETLNLGKLRDFREVGINRLSMGVQALNEEALLWLGRVHTVEKALNAYDWARKAGFDNINLDFIYGRPFQRCEDWEEELERIVALGSEHLSLYELTVEAGTLLEKKVQRGEWSLPDEDEVLAMYRLAREKLEEHHFRWYEVSNYAQPDFQARHNLDIWHGGEYLGLGAGAHSFGWIGSFPHGARRENPRHLTSYLRAPLAASWQSRSQQMILFEALLNAFRLREALEPESFERRYKVSFSLISEDKLDKLRQERFLFREGNKWNLSSRGVELLDSVISYLIDNS